MPPKTNKQKRDLIFNLRFINHKVKLPTVKSKNNRYQQRTLLDMIIFGGAVAFAQLQQAEGISFQLNLGGDNSSFGFKTEYHWC
ncbi:MAG: hypothetical protein KJ600_04595 [Nanoarchaeota archaeon]|nr:hypothetical protein [Nanoarchaeota archaeon]MBU1103807.1 hypothetical protein [Nanoarchaeota archaeon]